MDQCSFSIRGRYNHLIFIILKMYIMTRIFHRLFLWKLNPCQAVTSVLCLLFRPKTAHCSTKNAYTSEISFLALVPYIQQRKCFRKAYTDTNEFSPCFVYNLTLSENELSNFKIPFILHFAEQKITEKILKTIFIDVEYIQRYRFSYQ